MNSFATRASIAVKTAPTVELWVGADSFAMGGNLSRLKPFLDRSGMRIHLPDALFEQGNQLPGCQVEGAGE